MMIEHSRATLGKFAVVLLLASLLPGCAELVKSLTPEPLPQLQGPTVETESPAESAITAQIAASTEHGFYLSGQDSVVGHLASVPVQDGDTLLDVARHFGLGYQSIVDANPDVDPWVPEPGVRAVLPRQFILPDAKRTGVVVNLAAMRLFYFAEGKRQKLLTWPIGIGREGRSTPLGSMTVDRKTQHPTWYVPESIRKTHEEQGDPLPAIVPPGPDNPLGDFALYLSKPSYLIHGTNKPFSIGFRASNGCLRLYPEDIKQAFKEIPTKTPVIIVNQPYLLGWLKGELYLEIHKPFEEIDLAQAKNNLVAKLRQIAKQQSRKLDWPKIEATLKLARGIPTPIFEHSPTLADKIAAATALDRPARLTGQPEVLSSTLKTGWYVRTTHVDIEFLARRLAAQLNHLGPRIPARTVQRGSRYQVLAGPFAQEKAAQKAQLAISEDFGTKSELISPAKSGGRKEAKLIQGASLAW